MNFNTNWARLEQSQEMPSADVSRERGGLKVTNEPARMHVDNSEAWASTGLRSVHRSIDEAARRGVQLGKEGTGRLASDGNYLAAIQDGSTIPRLAAMSIDHSMANMQMAFIPSVAPDITWDPPVFSLNYEMDKLSFDWRTQNRPEMQYVPGNVEVDIEQYNKVVIEYLGGPMYVPPSAAPNYSLEAWA
jgi:hypothetical protein